MDIAGYSMYSIHCVSLSHHTSTLHSTIPAVGSTSLHSHYLNSSRKVYFKYAATPSSPIIMDVDTPAERVIDENTDMSTLTDREIMKLMEGMDHQDVQLDKVSRRPICRVLNATSARNTPPGLRLCSDLD